MRTPLSIAAGLLLTTLASAQTFEQRGTPPRLVELYTSQGCSSCPPADNRLATLLEHPKLWREFIPLAFHVDYWDYLGWQDRFAQAQFSHRQRQLKRSGQFRSVYTPAWMIDGHEWRGFFRGEDWPALRSRDGGLLRAQLNDRQLHVSYSAAEPINQPTLHIAVLGFDLETQIAAGENHGMTSNHHFVVLSKQELTGSAPWQLTLPTIASGQKTALVVWLTDGKEPLPRQTLGGWIISKQASAT